MQCRAVTPFWVGCHRPVILCIGDAGPDGMQQPKRGDRIIFFHVTISCLKKVHFTAGTEGNARKNLFLSVTGTMSCLKKVNFAAGTAWKNRNVVQLRVFRVTTGGRFLRGRGLPFVEGVAVGYCCCGRLPWGHLSTLPAAGDCSQRRTAVLLHAVVTEIDSSTEFVFFIVTDCARQCIYVHAIK